MDLFKTTVCLFTDGLTVNNCHLYFSNTIHACSIHIQIKVNMSTIIYCKAIHIFGLFHHIHGVLVPQSPVDA